MQFDKLAHRCHIACGGAHIDAGQAFRCHTAGYIALDHHTEELAEGVEVRSIKTTIITLQHREHHLRRDAGLLGFRHVYVDHILRIVRVVRGHGLLDLRAFVQLCQEALGHFKELVQVAASLVLHGHGHTVLYGETWNHRRTEGQDLCVLDACRLLVDHTQHGVLLIRIDHECHGILVVDSALDAVGDATGTVFKGLQLDDERCLV